jgi:hypothetical protein
MKKRALLVEVKNNARVVKEVYVTTKGLEEIYKVLDCRLVDVVRDAKIAGRTFDIIVDDEGLLIERPIASALCENYYEVLFGNILIVRRDKEGRWRSLTKNDVEHIIERAISTRAVEGAIAGNPEERQTFLYPVLSYRR